VTPLLLLAAATTALPVVSQAGKPSNANPTMIDPTRSRSLPYPPTAPHRRIAPSSALSDGGAMPGTRLRTSRSQVVAGAGLLGPPDFDGYCRSTGQGPVSLVTTNAYGWRCTTDNGTGDDAQAVCVWTYHTTNVTNRVADFNNPRSWQCWRVSQRLGAVNFTAYCTEAGYSGANHDASAQAYGWYCTGSLKPITSRRCLYGSTTAISRFQNFYDKNSCECWA
jgi:hypothetical protein